MSSGEVVQILLCFTRSLFGVGSFTQTPILNHYFGLKFYSTERNSIICSSWFAMLSIVEENCSLLKPGFSLLFIIVAPVMISGASS